ncbi:MAG: dihydroneopterin aldolase [Acidimicrobiales bacterium]
MPADCIELRGLRAVGICGALPEEQARPQPLEVDLDLEADLTAAGASDDLADTVDYAAVAARIEQVVTTERFTLLERLAQRLCDVVLDDDRVLAVTVAVRKLRPPIPQQADSTGVRIRRVR